MRVHLCAVGRLASRSHERALVNDYLARFGQVGRGLGWRFGGETEVEDKKGGGPAGEAGLLQAALPPGGVTVCLDERGADLSSPEFAARLSRWADQGRGDVAFVIGGADGIDPSLRNAADLSICFGKMVWPHKLVRVMLAEQLYRAATIQAGLPYHRL
ncbi:23S rRNA (pseudouridine(1915)-N(3))-methyltransferase RlmH [Marivita sp. GX14005]|uniref:23S rRNA (pseudouridine(1915)-N(3))-methyltransferase RlmH n=1 Tax=Marivita sp. GX14005 TaxID=2942276 RepID=UPI002018AEE5|nr:23S rRNA (pseudouridine(1915)-N(3))-methyltransferase RlmH [Marivita sp. GX14005]MCL3881512.1 23S rRNA (pseudouridine(1915)-N(3))-methyltransferase RlmH [Marivita sp. GX14005]